MCKCPRCNGSHSDSLDYDDGVEICFCFNCDIEFEFIHATPNHFVPDSPNDYIDMGGY